MSRLINMEDAIRAIEEEWDGCCSEYPATQIIYDTTEAIERLPIIQPEITHEQAVAYLRSTGWMQEHDRQMMLDGAHRLTAQPEIVRCKDCKWWDRYNDNNGYCMAAKSCTYTSHWDIQIRRTYDGDFYCAHAEPKEEYEEDEDE